MDLELGLKISHTVDDHVSSANFRIAKDKSSPLFVSKETESAFILTAHLKGYRRGQVDIDINEDGTQISISGEKPVQEKVMLGWIMYNKEVEMRGLRKVFRIPDGVILDRIKAKFNEHESILTIVMPKLVKGIRGVGIEEVKEDGEDMRKRQIAQPVPEEVPEKDNFRGEGQEEIGEPEKTKMEENLRIKGKGKVDEDESKREITADAVLQKDLSGSKTQEEANDSKTQEMKNTTKSVLENIKEPRIARTEEADGVKKDKVGTKEFETEHIVADKLPKSKTTEGDKSKEVTHEVAKPSQETQVITKHDHKDKKASELPKLAEKVKKQKSPEAEREMRKAGLKEYVRSTLESSESPKPAARQQEAQLQQKQTTDEVGKGDVVPLQKQEPIKDDPASYQNGKGERSHGNEIEEAAKNEEHNIKEKEVDKCGGTSEKEVDEESSDHVEKKPAALEKSSLLCSPFIIAGSALIVSLVMLAINRIRTRKR